MKMIPLANNESEVDRNDFLLSATNPFASLFILQVSESNCGGLDYSDDCVQGQNFIVVCRPPFVFSHVVYRTHTHVLFSFSTFMH